MWGYYFAESFYLPSERQYCVSPLALVTRLRSFVSTPQPYLISQIPDSRATAARFRISRAALYSGSGAPIQKSVSDFRFFL